MKYLLITEFVFIERHCGGTVALHYTEGDELHGSMRGGGRALRDWIPPSSSAAETEEMREPEAARRAQVSPLTTVVGPYPLSRGVATVMSYQNAVLSAILATKVRCYLRSLNFNNIFSMS